MVNNIIILIVILIASSASIISAVALWFTIPKEQEPAIPDVFQNKQEETFKKTLQDPIGGSGGTSFDMLCPDNSHVVGVYGGSGTNIDRIGVKCSDGSDIAPSGGKGGKSFTVSDQNGFNKMNAYYNTFINGMLINDTKIGMQSGNVKTFDCGSGKIQGFKGKSGDLIDSLGVHCIV